MTASTATLKPVQFNFDAADHVYTVDGVVKPHITGMLQHVGEIDDTWFTEESCDRGTAVHDLTAAYDLGALDPRTLVSKYKNYVLAHVKAMQLLRPMHLAVEEPEVHPYYQFGGRPDRVLRVHKVLGVYEVKTGVKPTYRHDKPNAHEIQTALQAILVAWRYGLEPRMLQRHAGYYTKTGGVSIETHRHQARDHDRAMAIIRECCHV